MPRPRLEPGSREVAGNVGEVLAGSEEVVGRGCEGYTSKEGLKSVSSVKVVEIEDHDCGRVEGMASVWSSGLVTAEGRAKPWNRMMDFAAGDFAACSLISRGLINDSKI